MKRNLFVGIALLFAWSTLAQDLTPVNKRYYNVDENGLALKGYDPVSYWDGTPKKGQKTFVSNHEGNLYHFSSKANQRKFDKNPEKYLPQYGGYCALGLGVKPRQYGFNPQKFDANPETYEIIDEKLYLFFNTPLWNAKQFWDRGDKKVMIASADSLWAVDEMKYEGLKIPEGMSPKAPPETLQMAFLVGRWKIRFMRRVSATDYVEQEGLWYGDFTPDGMSIVDYWSTGMEVSGINVRTYDPYNKKWSMTWAQNNNVNNKALIEGEEVDGKMVFYTKYWDADPEGRFVNRITFYNVTPTSFSYFIDASYDGGKTWQEKIKKIEATRITG